MDLLSIPALKFKEIGYLSDRFMELVECAVKEAALFWT